MVVGSAYQAVIGAQSAQQQARYQQGLFYGQQSNNLSGLSAYQSSQLGPRSLANHPLYNPDEVFVMQQEVSEILKDWDK